MCYSVFDGFIYVKSRFIVNIFSEDSTKSIFIRHLQNDQLVYVVIPYSNLNH